MNIKAGKILISSSLMEDENFKGTVLFITEHNDEGDMAFVINKIFERPLNALAEFNNSPAFPLYDGGPVDKEHLFFIHRCNDLIAGGEKIIDDIYLGGDFKKAITLINNKTITESVIKIFIGYCGWDKGELDAEIEEGSWEMMKDNSGIVFGI
jgi:putative transcriptional regulator